MTSAGTAVPYCPASTLFEFHDWNQCADLLRDGDGPRPTRLRLLDPASREGEMLAGLLLAASGELESAALVGRRYAAADLAGLAGAGLSRLQKVVADLAFWSLVQRRQPAGGDPKTCPGAVQALEELDRLRNGERIFSFDESAGAGLPSVSQLGVDRHAVPLVEAAWRYFGGHRTGVLRDRRGY